jgi:hypothetical protein
VYSSLLGFGGLISTLVPSKERVMYYALFQREILPPLRATVGAVDGNIRLSGKFSLLDCHISSSNIVCCFWLKPSKILFSVHFTVDLQTFLTTDSHV